MASIISAGTTSGTSLNLSGDTSGVLQLASNGSTTAVTIDTSQNVGIGTASPTDNLYVSRATNAAGGISVVNTNNAQASQIAQLYLQGGDNAYAQIKLQANSVNSSIRGNNDGSLAFLSSTTERMRITSTGVMYLGPLATNFSFTNGSAVDISGSGTGIAGTGTNLNLGVWNGPMVFQAGNSGSALVERMRIDSSGILYFGTTTANPPPNNVTGVTINASTSSGVYAAGVINASANGQAALSINRGTDDGTLVNFYQAGTVEGSISVSGSTVSYNGGHLSRWSQLPDNSKDDTLLKGTVMSNLDDMCVWTKDGEVLPNEQLNKMKVSDVDGDINVAGVFVNWDNEDVSSPIDMNVAMTGDMIIRIAEGVVVQKGDLLMSAGDGTAKPQGDDIVRSKTIAKVTSNHVTCTYADGSYCVPCVLMAC